MQVSVRNFRGCERADFAVGPIALVAGDGGASKTSIMQALAAVATGTTVLVPGTTKGNALRLVRSGSEKASVKLETGDWSAEVKWPKCEYQTSGDVPFVSPFAVGLDSIIGMDPKKRASTLAPFIKSDPTLEDLALALRDAEVTFPTNGVATEAEAKAMKGLRLDPMNQRDVAVYRVAMKIWPTIEADGWDKAFEHAGKTGTELKGQWKNAAGGETYGSSKAEGWLPKDWDEAMATASRSSLEQALAEAERAHEDAIASRAVSGDEMKRLQSLVDSDVPDVASFEAKVSTAADAVEAAKTKLANLPQAESGGIVCACPHCSKDVTIVVQRIDQAQTKYSLSADTKTMSDSEAKKRRDALFAAESDVRKAEREMKDAETALERARLRASEVEAARTRLDELQESAQGDDPTIQTRQQVEDARRRIDLFAKKEAADKVHRQIVINQAIIDVLGPSGVRRSKLVKVLEAFNDMVLGELCDTAGWKRVAINEDLELEYNGRTYSLLCKSEQYRCRFAMQVALAKLSRSALIVIDDADAIPSKARGGLIQMLESTGIPSVVAMMVAEPKQVPDLAKLKKGVTLWVEGGRTETHAEALARFESATKKAA